MSQKVAPILKCYKILVLKHFSKKGNKVSPRLSINVHNILEPVLVRPSDKESKIIVIPTIW
jgi:hypothetical protein